MDNNIEVLSSQIIYQQTLFQNTTLLKMIVKVFFVVCFTILVFNLEANIQPIAKSSVNSQPSFKVDFQLQELQAKRIELEQRLKRIKNQDGCPKPEVVVDNCQQLRNETQLKRVELDLKYQKQVNQRMIYQSKWETTCQSWKHEIEVLTNKTISQQQELNNYLLKVQQMADQIAQLTIQLKQTQICPECPTKQCPECPADTIIVDPQPCKECQVCPICKDDECDQLQEEYKELNRNFEICEQQLEQCYSIDTEEGENCTHVEQEAKDALNQVISHLDQNLLKDLKVSSNLQQAIKRSTGILNESKSLKESLSAITFLIDGLFTELQSQPKESTDNKGILLEECMSSFKRGILKLKLCEDKLTPFISNKK